MQQATTNWLDEQVSAGHDREKARLDLFAISLSTAPIVISAKRRAILSGNVRQVAGMAPYPIVGQTLALTYSTYGPLKALVFKVGAASEPEAHAALEAIARVAESSNPQGNWLLSNAR
jgi:hypothetical protein